MEEKPLELFIKLLVSVKLVSILAIFFLQIHKAKELLNVWQVQNLVRNKENKIVIVRSNYLCRK